MSFFHGRFSMGFSHPKVTQIRHVFPKGTHGGRLREIAAQLVETDQIRHLSGKAEEFWEEMAMKNGDVCFVIILLVFWWFLLMMFDDCFNDFFDEKWRLRMAKVSQDAWNLWILAFFFGSRHGDHVYPGWKKYVPSGYD